MTPLAAAALGRVLGAAIGAIGSARGPRPIHTTGLLLTGRLSWHRRTSARSGIALIDERRQGVTAVAARLSRGASLTTALPDVIGLALRVGTTEAEGDLLLSATGIGVPGRFVLHPRRTPTRAFFATLMPDRGDLGPVLIGARSKGPVLPAGMEAVRSTLTHDPWRLELMFATPTGLWHRFAELELAPAHGPIDDSTTRFDPVLRPPRGAGTYGWARAPRARVRDRTAARTSLGVSIRCLPRRTHHRQVDHHAVAADDSRRCVARHGVEDGGRT